MGPVVDRRDITDQDGAVADRFDDGIAQFAQVRRHPKVADHNLPGAGGQIPACGVARGVGDGLLQFGQGDFIGAQLIRIRLDDDLFHASADCEHFGDTRHALKAAAHGPIRERAQISWGNLPVCAAEANEENFTHQG